MLYDVITLGNIRGPENDWEVNDAHYTGHEVELPEQYDITHVMKALKAIDVLMNHITRQSLYIEGETGESIYLRTKRDNRWLWELRPK